MSAPHDCFAHDHALLALSDAIALLQTRLGPVCQTEDLPVSEALGRVVAVDVVAQVTVPPHDNSAMDGYAYRAADIQPGQATVPVARRIAAGDPPGAALYAGTAIRIFTGAPMPPGADTVAMQEDCQTSVGPNGEPLVTLPTDQKAGANRRLAGEDVAAGTVVLPSGRRLRGPDLAMAASVGHRTLTVYRPLKVALFSTGNELKAPGEALEPGQIYDSNRFGVAGCLQMLGCAVTDLGSLPDNAERITAALELAARDHQLVVTSGGVSMGDEDHVKKAIERIGTLHFWRLAVKPGRPLALGSLGDTVFLGLPGNPVAALVSLMLIGRAVIHRLQGRTAVPMRRYRLPSAFAFSKKAGRQEFIRCWLEDDANGQVSVQRFASQGSGVLSSMVKADGLVDVTIDTTEVRPGDLVDFLPFAEALW